MQANDKPRDVPALAGDAQRPMVVCEDAVAWLDDASAARPLNEDLLSFDGAAGIRSSIKRLLKMLDGVDVGSLISRQGWLHRLTGADIEARLRFELSVKQVNALLDDLRLAVSRAQAQLQAMQQERFRTSEDQLRLADLITYATELKKVETSAEAFVINRFERRIGNMMTMHHANTMAIAQFELAENGLSSLIDRYSEISSLLVPLWQQHAFAVIHAPARLREDDPDVANLLVCQSALEEYFQGESRL